MPIRGAMERTVRKTRWMYRILHLTSRSEAISYVLLLIATFLKYAVSYELGVKVVGPIHGVLYLIFVAVILMWFRKLNWSFKRAIIAIVLGSVPGGGFLVDQWITNSAKKPSP